MRRPTPHASWHRRPAAIAAVLAVLLGLLALVPLGTAGTATAQELPPAATGPLGLEGLVLRTVDARDYPTVSATVQPKGAVPTGGDYVVAFDGVPVDNVLPTRLPDAGTAVDVVFAVDLSSLMEPDGALTELRAVLAELVEAKPAGYRWGLVAFDTTARQVTDLTADPARLLADLPKLRSATRREAVLLDGVNAALRLWTDDRTPDDVQKNVVVIGAGGEDLSSASFAAVRGDLVVDNVGLFALHLAERGGSPERVRALADDSGGWVASIATTPEMGDALSRLVATIEGQYVLTFEGPQGASAVDVSVSVGDVATGGGVRIGEIAYGANARPGIYEPLIPEGPSFFKTAQGRTLAVVLALGACVLFSVGVAMLFLRDRPQLEHRLQVYVDPTEPEVPTAEESGGLASSRFMRRAVEVTGALAERRGLLTAIGVKLEHADIPLRPAEAVFFGVAAVLVMSLGTLAFTGSPVVALAVFVIGALVPLALLNRAVTRRRKRFEAQLPDTLQLLAGSLKAGYALMQGLEAVSREVPEPMGKELRRIVVEARLGKPIEAAMSDSATRMQSDDFSWAVLAIGIQREIGGNLAELLLTVADTMVQRERLRRDVKSLTAEGRVSAQVLAVLPIGLGAVMNVVNPDYMRVLFSTSTGHIVIAIAMTLMVVGFLWMRKVTQVDV